MELQIATFGGGCFWCVEAVFEQLIGVEKVISGYAGGHVVDPSYDAICSKTTGHAEVIQIYFDPHVISYSLLLEIFWTAHDPTTLNRQGNDKGPQYRSVIFYHNEEQKDIAEASILNTASTIWDDPIVTELNELPAFYTADISHQDYYRLNSNQGYCQFVINPKIAKVRSKFASRIRKSE